MEKKKIYIAAPLFNEGERAFNERIDAILRECGHETFLPQREGGCVADLPETIEGLPKRKYLFRLDCAHMDWCDMDDCGTEAPSPPPACRRRPSMRCLLYAASRVSR